MKNLNELVDALYPQYGAPGSRDVDITARRKAIDESAATIAEAFRALEQRAEAAEEKLAEEKRINSKLREDRAGLARECNAFEAKLAELQKQEPVLYALRFKNSRGQPEKLINENCLFRDKEKAAAYGLGGNYVTQESGKVEWVPNPALNPEVIPLFTLPAPAINLAELLPDEVTRGNEDVFDVGFANGFNACRAAMLRNIEEQ